MSHPTTSASLIDRAINQLAGIGIAATHLREIGRLGERHDLLHLERGHSQQEYRAVMRSTASLADVAMDSPTAAAPTIVVVDHISPRSADALRRARVNYVDTAGNAYVEFGDVLIDVRGRPRPKSTRAATDPGPAHARSGNLFSAGRSQVVCAILTWPRLLTGSTREVAEHAGVSVGLAHDALRLLRDADLADGSAETSTRLLELWTAAFPTGLAHRLRLAEFNGDPERLLNAPPDDVALSGETAVPDLVKPSAATLYVTQLTPHLITTNRWRTDGPANIVVRRAFWHTPANAPATTHAPWPLVYADLMSTDDARLRETAERWKTRFV